MGGFILLLALLAAAALLYDGNTRIVTTEYEVFFNSLPAAFDGYRILELSDLHAAELGADNARLIAAVRDAKPDMIAVTGDMIDAPGQLPAVLPLMKTLTEIAPVYFVTGNHEWDSGEVRELLAALPEYGVTVLRNQCVTLERGGAEIVLLGLDDRNGPADMLRPPEVFARLRAQHGDAFVVTLVHRNDYLSALSELGCDLVVCGHAHGGIVRPPFTDGLIGPNREWFPTYTNGVYTEGGTTMVVSRGVGNHTGYPRFLNNPHLPVAVLRSYE
ncbi:MAG: metallophosphoesterase [Oscillospiraceae bacterium]|nr:metallophosphoesterase [Oscillospiraceae bacterium]